MEREEIIRVVIWTMTYYGSNAGEKENPGSKLQSQAEHIADVINDYNEAWSRIRGLKNVGIVISGHTLP